MMNKKPKEKMIEKWKLILSLTDWDITTQAIDPNAVTYDNDIPIEERFYIGVSPNHTSKTATIYHDRELTERDIIHELLHVRNPSWGEDRVNKVEKVLYYSYKQKQI
jgi:hypothetical protein